MADSNPGAYDFLKLMGSAADNIPTKRKLPPGKYKFRCTFSLWDPAHSFQDGSSGYQFRLGLQAIANLSDPAEELGDTEAVFTSWNNRTPDFLMGELADFIKAHGFKCEFKDAVPELKGRIYTGAVSLAKNGENINVRGLMPTD